MHTAKGMPAQHLIAIYTNWNIISPWYTLISKPLFPQGLWLTKSCSSFMDCSRWLHTFDAAHLVLLQAPACPPPAWWWLLRFDAARLILLLQLNLCWCYGLITNRDTLLTAFPEECRNTGSSWWSSCTLYTQLLQQSHSPEKERQLIHFDSNYGIHQIRCDSFKVIHIPHCVSKDYTIPCSN